MAGMNETPDIRPACSGGAVRVPVWWMITLLLLSGAAGCSHLGFTPPGYDVRVEQVPDGVSVKELESLSEAWHDRETAGAGDERLVIRYHMDAVRMQRYLHSLGYYSAGVDMKKAPGEKRPVLVFTVTNAILYTIRSVELEAGHEPVQTEGPAGISLAGQPAEADAILAAGRASIRDFREQGYPFASMGRRTVHVYHDDRVVDVIYHVNPGSRMRYGTTSIEGLKRVDEPFVRRFLSWKPGDRYRQSDVDELGRRLGNTGLFSFIDLERQARTGTVDEVDMTISLQERRSRTVSLGVGYQSDIGAEVTGDWEHRNLFGSAEKLSIGGRYAEEQWLGRIRLDIPFAWRSRHDLAFGMTWSEEDSDAYVARSRRLFSEINHRVGRGWSLRYGPAVKQSNVDQAGSEEGYLQASFPVRVSWGNRDDGLNPTRGTYSSLQVEPFYDLEENYAFNKLLLTPIVYLPVIEDRVTLGWRVTVGSLAGTSLDGIPGDERFYAGGGQSIRGYAYQSVGPRNEDGELTGGKSLFETSLEMRWRLADRVGLVGFLDGGSSYEPEVSDFEESFQWGAGVGFRYFTGVGPIRADVGFPINRRPEIDNTFEFYVSIGQAF